jgi:hypothetical protein
MSDEKSIFFDATLETEAGEEGCPFREALR